MTRQSEDSVVMVPRWLWESLGEILHACQVSCSVPVSVGSSSGELSGSVSGLGVRADGRALVSVCVWFGDEVVESEFVAGETSEWGLS